MTNQSRPSAGSPGQQHQPRFGGKFVTANLGLLVMDHPYQPRSPRTGRNSRVVLHARLLPLDNTQLFGAPSGLA